jgi:hypothetical protein
MNDHCVLDYSKHPQVLRCLECGDTQELVLPMAISAVVTQTNRFIADHRKCRPLFTSTSFKS